MINNHGKDAQDTNAKKNRLEESQATPHCLGTNSTGIPGKDEARAFKKTKNISTNGVREGK